MEKALAREARKLRGFFRRRGVTESAIDDVVQETFLRLVRSMQKRRIRKLGPYLGQAAKYVLADWRASPERREQPSEIYASAVPVQLQPEGPAKVNGYALDGGHVAYLKLRFRIVQLYHSGWRTPEALARDFKLTVADVERMVKELAVATTEEDLKPRSPCCGDE